MEKSSKVIITFFALVLLIAFLYLFSEWFSKATGYIVDEDPDNYLAKCMTKQDALLYISKSCPDCDMQKRLFGESAIKFVNYTDCSNNPSLCRELKGVPSWKINNTIYYGVKTLSQLRILSGCVN